jgi:hypothetical protein
MYVDPNNVDALLAMSVDNFIVYFKLKRTHEGTFEVVELMNDPKVPEKSKIKDEEDAQGEKKKNEQEEKLK